MHENSPEPLFSPAILDRTVITRPLLDELAKWGGTGKPNARDAQRFPIIVVTDAEYPGGFDAARAWVADTPRDIVGPDSNDNHQGIDEAKTNFTDRYVFGAFDSGVIRELAKRSRDVAWNNSGKAVREPITNIWPDFEIQSFADAIPNVESGAEPRVASALGAGINWAIIDSGIDKDHPHFREHRNLDLPAPRTHMDFAVPDLSPGAFVADGALIDAFGHGTHVAGLVAGEVFSGGDGKAHTAFRERDEEGSIRVLFAQSPHDAIPSPATKCKLVSLKVLDEQGRGHVSSIIAALGHIQRTNGNSPVGIVERIHGVNISVGHDIESEWQVGGPTPLRVEINRLVAAGVIVVAADGSPMKGDYRSYTGLSEPGNAERAISVASTLMRGRADRVFGFTSPKKLQIDESEKPDIISPVFPVLSCAAGYLRQEYLVAGPATVDYIEDSGTSVTAARVSGIIAALLSVRKDLIGQPDKVKRLITSPDGLKVLNSNAPSESLAHLNKQSQRTQVFISYSREDKEWLARLRVHLSPLQRKGVIDVWDDGRIKAGEKWKEKISEALASARVAVLLISADFLHSDFIQSNELPDLLAAAENEGLTIMSVIIKPSLYTYMTSISQFQAINPPSEPLIGLDEGRREAYWLKLAEELVRVFDAHSAPYRE